MKCVVLTVHLCKPEEVLDDGGGAALDLHQRDLIFSRHQDVLLVVENSRQRLDFVVSTPVHTSHLIQLLPTPCRHRGTGEIDGALPLQETNKLGGGLEQLLDASRHKQALAGTQGLRVLCGGETDQSETPYLSKSNH
ncbi:hypothetical protein F7725_003848 [Dissostichus mawsoni]|uniref:Uncharacterized protein n=1 Tax=Dissostichus mawsoni TaxID=36200 RepID=A0A7J5YBG3_DISMA|nr:hypothetical protein F7725_003848 [Dissostichus mawsoni]